MAASSLSAADGFVLAMLAMMTLSGGVIALLIFCGLRNSARRNHEVDELLDEVRNETEREKSTPAQAEAPKTEPWEREGDWWKK